MNLMLDFIDNFWRLHQKNTKIHESRQVQSITQCGKFVYAGKYLYWPAM